MPPSNDGDVILRFPARVRSNDPHTGRPGGRVVWEADREAVQDDERGLVALTAHLNARADDLVDELDVGDEFELLLVRK